MRMIIEYKQDLDKCSTNDTSKDDDDKCLCAGVPVFFLISFLGIQRCFHKIREKLSIEL